MPITSKEDVAWALFGTGDIAFCGAEEQNGDRHYLAFQHHTPGEIGHEYDVGRDFPIQDGWAPGSTGPCIVFEFSKVESLDQVMAALVEHRRQRFPETVPKVLSEGDFKLLCSLTTPGSATCTMGRKDSSDG